MSSAAGARNTAAEPVRERSDPVLEELSVRDIVVPLAVYVPSPISQALPSSMMYRTTLPSVTPAAEKLWYPEVGDPSVTVPVPVVAVETRALFPYFGITAPSEERRYADSAIATCAASAVYTARVNLTVRPSATPTSREAAITAIAHRRRCCRRTAATAAPTAEVYVRRIRPISAVAPSARTA